MRLLGTVLKGMHLYFSPLLALLADLIVKFQQGDQHKRILELLRDIKSSTTATVFFCIITTIHDKQYRIHQHLATLYTPIGHD